MTITREKFIAATGFEPKDDDLERCNCDKAGQPTHTQCGWSHDADLPMYLLPPPNVKCMASDGSYVISPNGGPPLLVKDDKVEKLYPLKG